jgi:hypothetical protein
MKLICRLKHKAHHFTVRNEKLCMKCDRNLIQFIIDSEEPNAPTEQDQGREAESTQAPIEISADYYNDEVNTR